MFDAMIGNTPRRWYVLAMLTAVYMSNIADRYVISTLIEPIKAELRISDSAIGFLTASDLRLAKSMLWVFAPVGYLYLVPAFSWIQNLSQPRMRGFICAVFLFGANVANLALAPQLIGLASDIVAAHSAAPSESLRMILSASAFTGFWAAYHFWAAGRGMAADLERAAAPVAATG